MVKWYLANKLKDIGYITMNIAWSSTVDSHPRMPRTIHRAHNEK